MVGADLDLRPAEPLDPLDPQLARPYPVYACAHPDQETAKVLDVRLGGRVSHDRRAPCEGGGHDHVLSAGDTGFIEEDVGAAKLASQNELIAQLDLGTQLLQRVEVGVEAPPTDHIASRRRQSQLVGAGEHRTRQQDGGPDARSKFRGQGDRAHVTGLQLQNSASLPPGFNAQRPEQLEHGVHVPDVRDVTEAHPFLGQERRRHHRQGGVLVARRPHVTVELSTPFNDEAAHSRGQVRSPRSQPSIRRAGARRSASDRRSTGLTPSPGKGYVNGGLLPVRER